MQKPQSIKFDGVEYKLSSVLRSKGGPAPSHWTRVKFNVPNDFEAPKAVEAWLALNCSGMWRHYHFSDPKSKKGERSMVVRFEERNDALFFKLRGGHQAWEQAQEY